MLIDYIAKRGEPHAVWARRLGISPGHLSRILNGRKPPSLELAAKIEWETDGAVPAASWVKRPEALPDAERGAA